MVRWGEDILSLSELADLSRVEDYDSVCDMSNDGQIVGDEQVRGLPLTLELYEQVKDGRLD
jgi:hypothetical protein